MTGVYCKDCANRLRGRIDTLKTVYRGNICWEAMRRAEFDSMFMGSFEVNYRALKDAACTSAKSPGLHLAG